MADVHPETPVVDEVTALTTNLQQIREQNGYSTAIWHDDRLKRAAQGLIEFNQIATALSPDLAGVLLEDPGLQMCFLGVAPVEHFKTELTDSEVERLNAAFAMRGEKYFVVSYPQQLSGHKNHVLVNAEAAEAIMRENGDLFKDVNYPKTFLKTQPSQYLAKAKFFSFKINDQRHGVLAGYPRKTVNLWSETGNGLGRLKSLGLKRFGVGSGKEGFYFEGFNESDRQWANEAIALRQATKIGQTKI